MKMRERPYRRKLSTSHEYPEAHSVPDASPSAIPGIRHWET